ncbi:MAG TPA: hypothetical protein VII92_07700 [Anaerolineae bacterium]
MVILTTRATYIDGMLNPATRLNLPEGAAVEVQISTVPDASAIDPKDALLDDAAALQYLYAEFASEERQLAEAGLEHYASTLKQEEHPA